MDIVLRARHKLGDIPSAPKLVGGSGSAIVNAPGTDTTGLASTREGRGTLSGRSNERNFSLASDSKSESGPSTNSGTFISGVCESSSDGKPEDSEGLFLRDLGGGDSLVGLPKLSLRFWAIVTNFSHVSVYVDSDSRLQSFLQIRVR